MTLLVIVRHGQSIWNLENRFTGEVDVDLTPQGEEEARRAGRLLKNYRIDRAHTSVLRRAVHTLELILEETANEDVPVVRDAALNERNYGDLQGLNKAETQKKYGAEQVQLWRRSYDVAPPGGESLKDTFDRVIPYYTRAVEPGIRSKKNVLIVAHGNSLRALMMYLEGLSPKEIVGIDIPTGVPRQYEFDDTGHMTRCFYIK